MNIHGEIHVITVYMWFNRLQ